jgi:pimeloyl-ACP methyl ester carboxylesterase
MMARGVHFELETQGDDSAQALLWGHALMGSMHQEEGAGIMPWSSASDETFLVRWDARGHGASEATLSEGDYTWTELARDLWAIADGLNLDEVVLGGISMGAGTALHAAAMFPERTKGLIMMAPPTAWESRARQAQLYRNSAKMVHALGLAPLRWLGEWGSYAARNKALGKLQRSVTRGLKSADPRSVKAALLGAAQSDLPDPHQLEKLEIPTLILAWESDWSHPLSTAKALQDYLPDAQLVIAKNEADVNQWPRRLESFLEQVA